MFQGYMVNNRTLYIHAKAFRIVYRDQHFSFYQFFEKCNSYSLRYRNTQRLAIELDMESNLSTQVIDEIFLLQKANTCNFPSRTASVNVTKVAVFCVFAHIY